MTLASRLGRLETLVSAEGATALRRTERCVRWCEWASGILGTMQPDRAERVYQEMTEQPRETWGPVARQLDHLAGYGASGAFDTAGWPHWAERAIALPEAVCVALERHPDATWTLDYSCELCGLEVPHLPRVPGVGWPALLTVCPLCGGEVRNNGYTTRKLREASARVAEAEERHNHLVMRNATDAHR